ncbi:hypothetical protein IQ241_00725 [Romeria aff. gracilis LEGE 07310]|uniref:Uncharacterized protein n=1 Tax=Vasconcelosia minhoensis LEGE 07310 TaxID=915328 RepID=A0A8J7A4Q6_9CYAN|nr:hypothetical protein [Romeria gracilis]MBE9075835.1 hypothetical protein [Romeria aff. gracilis LEGE 07310]
MKTIETFTQCLQRRIATANHEGKLIIELVSDLPPGTHRAILVIDEALLAPTTAASADLTTQPEFVKTAWTALRAHAGTVEMPEDWSREHDHYLYGTPKRIIDQ